MKRLDSQRVSEETTKVIENVDFKIKRYYFIEIHILCLILALVKRPGNNEIHQISDCSKSNEALVHNDFFFKKKSAIASMFLKHV